MRRSFAYRAWIKDVAKPLVFEWLLLTIVTLACLVFGAKTAVNTLLAGMAIVLPHTVLGVWIGFRAVVGAANPIGVFIGSVIKTLVSVVFLGLAFVYLQDYGFVWLSFFLGLTAAAMSTMFYGVFGRYVEDKIKEMFGLYK